MRRIGGSERSATSDDRLLRDPLEQMVFVSQSAKGAETPRSERDATLGGAPAGGQWLELGPDPAEEQNMDAAEEREEWLALAPDEGASPAKATSVDELTTTEVATPISTGTEEFDDLISEYTDTGASRVQSRPKIQLRTDRVLGKAKVGRQKQSDTNGDVGKSSRKAA